MSQTLLAFLAFMIAMFFALHQQRRMIVSNESIVHSEFEIMANAVALQKLETVASSSYVNLFNHDDTAQTINFAAAEVAVPFDIAVDVLYTTESGVPSAVPTDYTQVAVSVTHQRYANPLVVHRRIFSP